MGDAVRLLCPGPHRMNGSRAGNSWAVQLQNCGVLVFPIDPGIWGGWEVGPRSSGRLTGGQWRGFWAQTQASVGAFENGGTVLLWVSWFHCCFG